MLPQYGGVYDKILIEDEKDSVKNSIPFYKTTNLNIFKPLVIENKYDLCIISNFTQLKFKGTDFIINQISKSDFCKKLKICHIGNNKEIGTDLCKKNNINNIEFLGSLSRQEINIVLNKSKFSIVNSNRLDGCPRVITEILCSETPLLINEETRLLDYYKESGVIQFNEKNFLDKILEMKLNYNNLKNDLKKYLNYGFFNLDHICKLNYNLWNTKK